jgi:hypothetical protein
MMVIVYAFREGKPENLRGYTKFSGDVISGVARDILDLE